MQNLWPPFLLVIILLLTSACQESEGEYVCPPCNQSCDELHFAKAGTCPHCKMTLVKKSELEKELVVNEVNLKIGSGSFLLEGGQGKEEKAIKVFYHLPKGYTAESKILMVIPGAGRNGDSYRDAWIEKSEQHNVVILSPMYIESDYDFGAYHMCGLMTDLNLEEAVTFVKNSNVAELDETLFSFQLNPHKPTWLFTDFDRIFDRVVETIGSNQKQYDLFGHSAGGQILHRMAIFYPDSKADRIMAANSGFYTLPDTSYTLPFGLKNTSVSSADLFSPFREKLVLLIGELDNETETGGTLLRSPTVDLQGAHRLARGQYFYETAKKQAEQFGADFNWELVIVPNVGHNHRKMGDTAAKYLYGSD